MFIFERLVGLFIYIVILFLTTFFTLKANVSCKKILRFYIICLCVMAFFYKPSETGDLYRIYNLMNQFSTMQFKDFWNVYIANSRIPVAYLLYWSVGHTGINNLLPVISTLISYSLIFYVMNKTQELYSISKTSFVITLCFLMTTSIYISVIGGIRMMISLSLIMYSYFRNVVEKKVGIFEIAFYILALLIHEMSYAVVGICLVTLLFFYKTKLINKLIFITIALIAILIFGIVFRETIQNVYDKFLEYIFGDKYSDTWEYIMGALIICLLLIVLGRFRYLRKKEEYQYLNTFSTAAFFFILVAICFSFEFSMFYRFGGQLAVLFSIPALMITLEKGRIQKGAFVSEQGYQNLVILFIIIIAVISCARGSLSSLKFF